MADKNGKKKKAKSTKDYHLGVRIDEVHNAKLEKRMEEFGDESKSQTARRILFKELDRV